MAIDMNAHVSFRHPGAGRRRQRGAVAIIAAIFLVAMLGIAAFAIDIGRWFVVKNELQNAADAAALAGAGRLYPPIATGPNWDAAKAQGEAAVRINASDRTTLSTGVVQPGYWDFQNRVFDSDTGRTRGENDLPAVRVTVERRAGINGGPVAMTFGRIFGTDSMDSAATATAVHGLSPSMAPEGTMSPFAISGCMFGPASDVWDPVAQAPIGQPPKKFIIASGAANNNHCDVGAAEKCYCGQWASSDGDNPNSANAMRNRIIDLNENPLHVSTGGQVDVIDETYIAPGVMSSLYDTAEQYWTGKTIRVAVVQDSAVLGTSGPTPVQGFACLHVYKVVKNDNCTHYENEGPLPGALGGNGKGRCFVVSLSNELSCRMPGGGAPGPGQYTGIPLPPRLVE